MFPPKFGRNNFILRNLYPRLRCSCVYDYLPVHWPLWKFYEEFESLNWSAKRLVQSNLPLAISLSAICFWDFLTLVLFITSYMYYLNFTSDFEVLSPKTPRMVIKGVKCMIFFVFIQIYRFFKHHTWFFHSYNSFVKALVIF